MVCTYFSCVSVCAHVHAWACVCPNVCLAVRGQPAGVSFPMPPCDSWGSNSDLHIWWHSPLSAEPSHHLFMHSLLFWNQPTSSLPPWNNEALIITPTAKILEVSTSVTWRFCVDKHMCKINILQTILSNLSRVETNLIKKQMLKRRLGCRYLSQPLFQLCIGITVEMTHCLFTMPSVTFWENQWDTL